MNKNLTEKIFLEKLKNCKWINKEPFKYINTIIELGFGIPIIFDENENGCIIWKKKNYKNLKIESIKICDECIPYNEKNIFTFIYVKIFFDIKKCKNFNQLCNFSKNIIIDSGKNTICARGFSFKMCITLLSIFTGISVCRSDIKNVIENNLDEKAIELSEKSEKDYLLLLESLIENLNE